jgi:hypothetical protein
MAIVETLGQEASLRYDETPPPDATDIPHYDNERYLDEAKTGRYIRRMSGVALEVLLAASGMVMAPYLAIKNAPPDHIQQSILGDPTVGNSEVHVDARAVIGRDVTALRFGGVTIYAPKSMSYMGIDVAGDISVDSSGLRLFSDVKDITLKQVERDAQIITKYEPLINELNKEIGNYYRDRAITAEEEVIALEAAIYALVLAGRFHLRRVPPGFEKHVKIAYAIGAGASAIAVAGGIMTFMNTHDSYVPSAPTRAQLNPDPIFNGTLFEGVEIDSIAPQSTVDALAKYITDYIDGVDSLRKTIDTNMAAENQRLYQQDTTRLDPDATREGNGDDFQGDWIMAGEEVKLYRKDHTSEIAIPGDVTMAGEPFVVYALKSGAEGKITFKVARSEHDPSSVAQLESDANFYITNADPKNPADIGKVQKIKGRKVLIVNYPESAPLGQPSHELAPGVPAFIANLQKAICEQQPDEVIEHDSSTVGYSMANLDCTYVLGHPAKDPDHVTLFMDGRSYTPQKTHVYTVNGFGKILELTQPTSGGLGPLSGPSFLKPTYPSYMTEVDHYKKLGIYTYQLKKINPDGTVWFSPEQFFSKADEAKFLASKRLPRQGSDDVPLQQGPGHR